MRREYACRGKRVKVEQLPLVAVRQPTGHHSEGAAHLAALDLGGPQPGLPAGVSQDEVETFGRSGWRFVPAEPGGSPASGTVFRHASGQLAFATDLMVVQLQPSLSPQEVLGILESLDLKVVHTLAFAPSMFEVRVPATTDPMTRSLELSEDPRFVFAEPELHEEIGTHQAPNDPQYTRQWHLKNTGQEGGKAGADLDAESAWQRSTGSGIVVAIIDNGFDVGHPDLVDGIHPQSGHFTEDSPGNFEFSQGFNGSDTSASLVRHGTFCAGMVGARANNGIDGRGVAYDSKLMLIACLVDQIKTQATLARALAYAADPRLEGGQGPGADVISCSLGRAVPGWKMTSVLKSAIDFAADKGRGGLGAGIFWAVDNAFVPLKLNEVCSYPNVIAVGPSDRQDQRTNSAYGKKLEFLAPGVDVLSTVPGGGFDSDSGSSFAAPCAAAVAALVLAVKPDLTWRNLRQILRDSCLPIGAGGAEGVHFGHGRVSAGRAVQKALT